MNTLSSSDVWAVSPLLILLTTSLIVLLIEAFADSRTKHLSFLVSLIGAGIAVWATIVAPNSTNPLLTNWLSFDPIARLFTLLFLFVGLGTFLLGDTFIKRFSPSQGEFYFLVIMSLIGLILVGSSADFLTLFLGLETLSVALYVLCCYMKKWEFSQESSMKYFLMGALAAAFLLYGIALVYGATGTTRFDALLPAYKALSNPADTALFLGGVALITLGFAFKAAIVPFHTWAPDVYAGAPSPVTAFMAVGTKAGAFAAFIRVFMVALPQFNPLWNEAIAWLAYPTLIYANIVAMRQVQLRRFFAYSGISHAGYLLIPLAAGGPEALPAILFYLSVYALATFGCFAVIAFLDLRSEGAVLHDLYGLFGRSPFLATLLTICLLTLAGIPPTAGFFAKFYVFKVAFAAGYYGLVIVGLLAAVFSAYYYLRFIGVMFSEAPAEASPPAKSWPALVLGTVCLAVIIFISVYPAPLLAFFQR